MKKILILLSAILLIASTFALGISADPYDEVQLPGLPEGVQGYEIEGASNENYPDLFEVTKKYFIVSMTLPFAEKVGGTLGDNGCVGLTIGNENYECFYIPHDVVDYHNGTRSPGFSEDPRAQIRVGAWWTSPAFGSYQTNYLDGQDGSITEDTLVGQDITIYVEGKVEFEDEASEAWKVTIKAWINDTPLVLNGGEMEVTAYDFDANPYVGYSCRLTGVTAQIKFAQSNAEIDRSVLVNGVPDDTGMPGIYDYECHHFYNKIKSDRDVHWNECDRCGEIYSIEMHTFEDGICTICSEEEILYGDANGDGKIDSKDIILLKKYIANLENGKSSVTLGHKVEVDPGYPATCTEDGMTDGKKCTDCGKVLASKEVIPASGHTFGRWIMSKEVTCTENGERQRICSQCGEKETEVIDSIGKHIEGEIIVDKEPTNTENGVGHTECINCGATIQANVPIEASDFTYTINDDGNTCTITGYKGSNNSITIPERIYSYTVTAIGDDAFFDYTNFTNITIPNSVTTFGESAFLRCGNLKTVNYDGDIESWLNISFYNYGSSPLLNGASLYFNGELVTDVVLPNTITWINDYVFCGCTSITSITIPNGVTTFGEGAFLLCDNLKTVNYDGDIESWLNISFHGDYWDSHSNPLLNGASLYFNGKLVTDVVVPNTITKINKFAFEGCKSLTSITIPEDVTGIGECAFYGCTNLSSVTIPDGVTYIDVSSFSGCTNLTSITIPDSVTSIGGWAFSGCTNLKTVNYTGDIESWLNISFGDYDANPCCNGALLYFGSKLVTDVVVPDTIAKIKDYAFDGCTSITSITIPDSVTSIGYRAFEDCTSLTSITIPDSVTGIGYEAFYYCTNLKTVNYTGDIESWLKISFSDYDANPCNNGASLYFGGELVTDVVVPDTIAKINNYAFCNWTWLASITIPDSVTSIGNRAFRGCTSLTSITIPDSVTSIGYEAFYRCTSITSITIPDGVTSIGDAAFEGCTSLTSITIPDSVTWIGYGAFYNCKNLEKVNYGGTADQWSSISIDSNNYDLTSATRFYYCETKPTTSGNYWHYVDDVVTEW